MKTDKKTTAAQDGRLLALVDENKFQLFEMIGRSEATKEIIECIDRFFAELHDLCRKWWSLGAADTASRDAIAIYIARERLGILKLDPLPVPSKKLRRRPVRRK